MSPNLLAPLCSSGLACNELVCRERRHRAHHWPHQNLRRSCRISPQQVPASRMKQGPLRPLGPNRRKTRRLRKARMRKSSSHPFPTQNRHRLRRTIFRWRTPISGSISAAPARSKTCGRCGANVLKSDARELASLHPIIVLKERSNGLGMQLRLVAGPLADAAAAARICAVLSENGRDCKTAVFDGQRLALKQNADESGTAAAEKKQRPSHASSRHRHSRRAVRAEEPAPPPPAPPPPPQPSTFGSIFSH